MFARIFESPSHLLILLAVGGLLLSYKKLPDMARSLGRSARILKSEVGEMKTEMKQDAAEDKESREANTAESRGTEDSSRTASI